MEALELGVVDYWSRHIRLDEERAVEVRQAIMNWLRTREADSGKTITAARLRIEKLDRQQAKLTQAYLADALPVEILKKEQDRVQQELAQANILIDRYHQDYQIIQAAINEALLMCQYSAVAYEHAEPEVRRQLIQAAFEKLWVMGIEIVGCDLRPGYVTLLDEELVAELERQGIRSGGEQPQEPEATHVHYRRTANPVRSVPVMAGYAGSGGEDARWLAPERPAGLLPWEARDPSFFSGVRGSNVPS